MMWFKQVHFTTPVTPSCFVTQSMFDCASWILHVNNKTGYEVLLFGGGFMCCCDWPFRSLQICVASGVTEILLPCQWDLKGGHPESTGDGITVPLLSLRATLTNHRCPWAHVFGRGQLELVRTAAVWRSMWWAVSKEVKNWQWGKLFIGSVVPGGWGWGLSTFLYLLCRERTVNIIVAMVTLTPNAVYMHILLVWIM